jgi:elongation factor G
MPTYTTEAIRNVVLLSHSGAGKTSLSEAMLFNTGAVTRLGKIDNGTTTSDYDPEEIRRQISINMSLLPLTWEGNKINLIDTPGYADFVVEVKAGMSVADGAIIVVCAASGVEVGTEQVWKYTTQANLPRMVLIDKMDRENADFNRTLEDLHSKFGRGFVPVQLPIGSHSKFEGVIDLVGWKAYIQGKEAEIPSSLEEEAKSYYEKLVEGVAEIDDDLMTKYLEGEELTPEEIQKGLRQGAKEGKLTPVLAGSGSQNIGVTQLMHAIVDYLPSPKERGGIQTADQKQTVEQDASAPLAAMVFKTSVDPYVGKLTCFRVYSGSISSNSQVWNSTQGQMERVGQLYMLCGKTQEPVSEVIAGDIGSIAKLAVTATGDTLCAQSRPITLPGYAPPSPSYTVALHPKTKADVDKMGTGVTRLVEEDPSLQQRREPDTGEMLLSGMGDTHIEVAIDRLQNKLGIGVEPTTPKVPYKETVTASANSEYKHKKQTGGHGQYGHVLFELEPLPRDSGFEFGSRVVGGRVPKNYIPAVEKGVMEARQEGVIAGYPVVDVKVTLYDGSSHPVDSSEMAFKIAGSHALKKGLSAAQPILLEPIVRLEVTVPETYTGDIVGDLNTKRARVLGMNPDDGKQIIEAHAPLAEVQRYAIDLRSMTQGRGSYIMQFSHYEEVPAHLSQKIVEERQAEKNQ